jgi:hypothetical protein
MTHRFSKPRIKVEPRDVPAEAAARRMGLCLANFEEKLAELLARGFPPPDPTTGLYDLFAIDEWMSSRTRPGALTDGPALRDARDVASARLREPFRGAR